MTLEVDSYVKHTTECLQRCLQFSLVRQELLFILELRGVLWGRDVSYICGCLKQI